jgi:Ca2+-transporting ATPase
LVLNFDSVSKDFLFSLNSLRQMTVVEACVGGKKIIRPDDKSQLSPILHSLLIEGVAHNTNGSIFVPKVW